MRRYDVVWQIFFAGVNMMNGRTHRKSAFTLVELMVVIGIIGLLIGILLPSLRRATEAAKSLQCKSNLHDLGVHLAIYNTQNKGYLFPVGPPRPFTRVPSTLGTTVPPHERWPAKVYRLPGAPYNPLPYDPAAWPGDSSSADPKVWDPAPFTPKTLICPSDENPAQAHSYVLNKHLVDNQIKASSRNFGGLTASDVIVAGEKVTEQHDYYMERGDNNTEFDRVAEKYRHGQRLGSNYLYFDGHVDTKLPNEALTGIDPWDLRLQNPATQPTSP
jgi:prepilin-type processing-associated H-X9-DG protein/prepilin-type N-terminal cleavage/methylation domain-containing protein